MVNGLADKSKEIKRHDTTSLYSNWPDIWHWNIDGKNLIIKRTDLEKTSGTIEENYFVFRKTS